MDDMTRFQWKRFKDDLPHNVRVNYADKCTLVVRDGSAVFECETEEIRAFGEGRWKPALERALMTDIQFEVPDAEVRRWMEEDIA